MIVKKDVISAKDEKALLQEKLFIFQQCESVNKGCWMWPIDFLITLSLLNNQATANALVITIQLAEQGL